MSVLWQTCSTGKACAPQALLVFVLLEPTQRYQPLTRSLTSFCPPKTDHVLFQGTFTFDQILFQGTFTFLLYYSTVPSTHTNTNMLFLIFRKKKKTILKKLFLEVTPPWNNLRREGPCFWEGGGIAWDQRLSLSILCSLVHYQ